MPTSALTTTGPVEQPTYTWIPAEGQANLFYKVDPTTGEYIYTTEAPQEGAVYQTRTRTYETGEYKDDPTSKRIYYTVQGYDEPEESKARLTWQGLKERNKAIRNIRNNYQNYGLSNKPSRWNLLHDEDLRSSLEGREYENKNSAYQVDHLLYPQKKLKTAPGYLYVTENDGTYTTTFRHQGCATCGDRGGTTKRLAPINWYGLAWQSPAYKTYDARIETHTGYDKQIPVTETVTEYAIAQPGSTQTQITATEQSGAQVPAVKRPVRRASTSSTTRQTTLRPVKKTTTTASPQTTAQASATGTRFYYDPDGGLIRQVPMSQEEVLAATYLRLGGKLNYLNYLN